MTSRQLSAMALAAGVWGASFLFIKVLLDAGMEPLGIAASRTALGGAALLPFVIFRRYWPDRRALLLLLLLGVGNMAIPWTLFGLAEERVESGVASIANASTPLWAALFAAILIAGEGLGRRQLLGLGLGFAGVVVLTASDLSAIDSEAAAGIGYILIATGCYGVSTVAIRRWLRGVPALFLAAAQISVAAFALLPFALMTGALSGVSMGLGEWFSVIALGVAGSAIALIAYMWLIGEVGAVRASVVTYLIPPIGVFLGWAILDEPLGWNLFAGLALVVLGVALVQGVPLARAIRFARGRPQPVPSALD
ncbi:MAG: DMT family transporter [Dehalococcoidia bacterium]